MKFLNTCIIGAVFMLSGQASGATQGMLGNPSMGDVLIGGTVTAEVLSEIQITGLEDVNFGTVVEGGYADPVTLSAICVYLTTASSYSILLESSNGTERGLMLGPNNEEWYYHWEYTGPDGTQAASGLGGIISGLHGSPDEICASGDMAILTLTPESAPLSGVGAYSDTLNLTVTPD